MDVRCIFLRHLNHLTLISIAQSATDHELAHLLASPGHWPLLALFIYAGRAASEDLVDKSNTP